MIQQLCEYVRKKGEEHDKNDILALARKLSLRQDMAQMSFTPTPTWQEMLTAAKQKGTNWLETYKIQNI